MVSVSQIDYYVDHTAHFERNTGIQRCVRAIARALIGEGVCLNPVIWDRTELDLRPATDQHLKHLSRWGGPNPSGWSVCCGPPQTSSWLLVVELVSGPHNPSAEQLRRAADQRGMRLAWVFHDAIPLHWSHLYGDQGVAAAAWHAHYMQGLCLADRVFANSQSSAHDLRDFLRARRQWFVRDSSALRALPLADGCSGISEHDFSKPEDPSCSYPGSIVLSVGSLEPRKNHRALIKALAWLAAHACWPSHTYCVLVGWANDQGVVRAVERAISCGLPLIWESDADDQQLQLLYRQCLFTVYPSLAEGFGLPVAESLAHGRICLCSSQGALAELAAGGGCLTVDTSAWLSIADGLCRLLHNASLRQQLLSQIASRQPRSWASYVRSMLGQLNEPSCNT
jgi:glycosyltransferase involved in cell wall biosynthesis